MGNSGSGQGEERKPSQINVAPARPHQNVFLDLSLAPRLRPTENGAILHNGGTISLKKQEKKYQNDECNYFQCRINFHGSEPDLRCNDRPTDASNNEEPLKLKSYRVRKKYKAPQAPKSESPSLDLPDEWDECREDAPSRRSRYIKNRAMYKKSNEQSRSNNVSSHVRSNSLSLHRSFSTPQFESELETSIERWNMRKDFIPEIHNKPPSNYNPPTDFHTKRPPPIENEVFLTNNVNKNEEFKQAHSRPKVASSGLSSRSSNEEQWAVSNKLNGPVKSFYFGMNLNENDDDLMALETFASQIHHLSQNSFETQSNNSEFGEDTLNESNEGISVQLRATLPRKQVEIPRFSPSAAWRMLSIIETQPSYQEDELVSLESRIIIAPPHPILIPDKSADSGISGDASPQQHDSATWTPQQDLEETSSDGGFPVNHFSFGASSEKKFTPRFTLSLPKDERVATFSRYDKGIQSLQVTNPTNSWKKVQNNSLNPPSFVDNNWVLSRSVPSSLNDVHNINKWNVDNYQDEDIVSLLTKKPSYSYLACGGHIMYLPEYSVPRETSGTQDVSKSLDEINPWNSKENLDFKNEESLPNNTSSKKFKFQSTLRQAERKKLAEKLSKEAEYKELERRNELEMMQRVEEVFQKKRELEKADLKQQLHLYNSNDNPKLELTLYNPFLSEYKQTYEDYKNVNKRRVEQQLLMF